MDTKTYSPFYGGSIASCLKQLDCNRDVTLHDGVSDTEELL